MEHDSTVYVGLDVHKESITIAYAVGIGDVELLGRIGTAKGDIDRLFQGPACACRLRGRTVRLWTLPSTGRGRIRMYGMCTVTDPQETR